MALPNEPAPRMRHEHAGHRDMAPAEMAGADTEIVLLAVALREQVLSQQPDLPQTVAPEVDAEAMRGRHFDHRTTAGAAGQTIEPERRHFVGERVRHRPRADS